MKKTMRRIVKTPARRDLRVVKRKAWGSSRSPINGFLGSTHSARPGGRKARAKRASRLRRVSRRWF